MRMVCILLSACALFSSAGCARSASGIPQEGTVLIDPGHGGFDGGAVAEDGTPEKHLNLAIATCLRDFLYVCGVPVEMTRTSDMGLENPTSTSIREKKVSDMRNRLSMYNEASLVIAIHQNQFSVPKYDGTQVFYSTNHCNSAILAESIRGSVIEWVQPQNSRQLKPATDGIYLLYHTEVPAVLVECGFLSNPEEREQLKTPAYQQQLAFAVAAGYWNYQAQM